jgi:regulator of sigma E protease
MLQSLGYTALLLGVLVTVHELGHFLVAKALNVKVLKFSIGFGPRLLHFTRGETEYRLSLVPLGGYVKMAGDMPYEELAPEEAHRGFLAQAPWRRALIVVAGPVFNLFFPVLVYFFVFLGSHQTESSRIGSVEPGLPAAEAKLLPGDYIRAVDGEKIETFGELFKAIEGRPDKPTTLTVERDGKTFTTEVTPTSTTETTAIETTRRGMLGISRAARPPVVGVPPGSIAENAGLKTFDRILSVNGKPVRDEGALNTILRELQGTLKLQVMRTSSVPLPGTRTQQQALVEVSVERQPGDGYAALGAESSSLYVHRVLPGTPAEKAGIRPGDRLVALDGQELKGGLLLTLAVGKLKDQPFELKWRTAEGEKSARLAREPFEEENELGKVVSRLELGVYLRTEGREENLTMDTITRHFGVREALVASIKVVPEAIRKMVIVIGGLFTGNVPLTTLGGPIMMYELAAKTSELGMDYFLQLMAMISINLGVMNLLPIPILDGFHLLSAFWEAIRRRPIPVRAREIANWVGFAMLIALMAKVFWNDLTR